MCYFQNCEGPQGSQYQFVAEELNPCPCRPTPPPPVNNTDVAAGGINQQAVINAVSSAEQQGNSAVLPLSSSTAPNVYPDEKKITTIKTSATGALPLSQEHSLDGDDPKQVQLVPANGDSMRTSSQIDLNPNIGDGDMLSAHRPETFMGKEGGCEEDVAESAVDLDGDTAIQMDAKAESRQPTDVSVAQMNLQINSRKNLMPDTAAPAPAPVQQA